MLARLEEQERAESDPWRRDDVRQSWIALYTLHAGKFPDFWSAFIAASMRMYGKHPDQLWGAIEARRRAQLGPLYEQFWGAATTTRKPPQSVPQQLWLWAEKPNGARAINSHAA